MATQKGASHVHNNWVLHVSREGEGRERMCWAQKAFAIGDRGARLRRVTMVVASENVGKARPREQGLMGRSRLLHLHRACLHHVKR